MSSSKLTKIKSKPGRLLISMSDPTHATRVVDKHWLEFLFKHENFGNHKIEKVKVGIDATSTFVVDIDRAKVEEAMKVKFGASDDHRDPVIARLKVITKTAFASGGFTGKGEQSYLGLMYRVEPKIQEMDYNVSAAKVSLNLGDGVIGKFEQLLPLGNARTAVTLNKFGYPTSLDDEDL